MDKNNKNYDTSNPELVNKLIEVRKKGSLYAFNCFFN